MKFKLPSKFKLIILIIVFTMLVGCTGSSVTQENANTQDLETGSTLAMVDNATVELRDNHYYAVINGNYPDACTKISSVVQVEEGNTISITLLTKSPDDVMCAMMLTPFTVDVLLTTGGLMPGEYAVVVNEGPSTTFSLEQ